jgi:preprotein translocase subunit SecG
MESLIIIVHVVAAIGITGLVLLQQGKGADMGASFGSGASQTLFGSVGSGNALTKSTAWLAVVFFATSLSLALFAKQRASGGEAVESSLIQNRDQIEALINTAPAGDLPAAPSSAAAGSDLPQAAASIEAAVDAALEAVSEVAGEAAADASDAATAADAE